LLPKVVTVSERGSAARCVLCGSGVGNKGVRVRPAQEQVRGHGGGITGRFVLLDAGDNVHSQALEALVNQETDAAEVLAAIRRERAGCVSVVNANALTTEPPEPRDPAG
jgi:hypothetical protein